MVSHARFVRTPSVGRSADRDLVRDAGGPGGDGIGGAIVASDECVALSARLTPLPSEYLFQAVPFSYCSWVFRFSKEVKKNIGHHNLMSAELVPLADSRDLHGDNEEEANKDRGLILRPLQRWGLAPSPLNTIIPPPRTQIPRIWVDQLFWYFTQPTPQSPCARNS